jgi:hypothetical protein
MEVIDDPNQLGLIDNRTQKGGMNAVLAMPHRRIDSGGKALAESTLDDNAENGHGPALL